MMKPVRILISAAALIACCVAGAAVASALSGDSSPAAPEPTRYPADYVPAPGSRALGDSGEAPGGRRVAVEVFRSSTGKLCAQLGDLVDGRVGSIGIDGKFRPHPKTGEAADCFDPAVLEGRFPGTVHVTQRGHAVSIWGVVHSDVQNVTIETAAGRVERRPGAGGSFVVTYPKRRLSVFAAFRIEAKLRDGTVRVFEQPEEVDPFANRRGEPPTAEHDHSAVEPGHDG